jgi:hypothetical protein
VNEELELISNDVVIPADIENTDTVLYMDVENPDNSLSLDAYEENVEIEASLNELFENVDIDHEKVVVIEAEAGGYYTPSVTQPDKDTVRIAFTPSKGSMLPVAPTDLALLQGEDGYTPQKGVDYFTEEDIAEIVDTVCDQITKFEGDYTVTPAVNAQTLETKQKLMTDNVTIKEIPFYDTSNNSGGTTVYIGSTLDE